MSAAAAQYRVLQSAIFEMREKMAPTPVPDAFEDPILEAMDKLWLEMSPEARADIARETAVRCKKQSAELFP